MPNVEKSTPASFINGAVRLGSMPWEIVAGVALAVIGMFVAMTRAGGDARWGLTSGILTALALLAVLALAQTSGLL